MNKSDGERIKDRKGIAIKERYGETMMEGEVDNVIKDK